MFDSQTQHPALDRFKSVDALADRIFDKIPELGDCIDPPQTLLPDNQTTAELAKSNVVNLFSSEQQDTNSILAKTEKLLGGLLQVLEGAEQFGSASPAEKPRVPPNFATAPDIGYRAAQRRQQLPEGVEILESAPTKQSDEAIMQSIRALMVAQEVEFQEIRVAKKREKAKEILAPLEPQDNLDEPPGETPQDQPYAPSRWLIRMLDRAFRNYYFLAISLSGWCTLAMMVLIDPAVSRALGFLSMVLLLAAYSMFAGRNLKPDVSAVGVNRI